ncbi:hypothetical protein TrLO_g2921, partial [Triparma laevis f. longispina]
ISQLYGHSEGDNMWKGFRENVVSLTNGKTRKIGEYVIILDTIVPAKRALVTLAKVKGESNKTIRDVWPDWTPKTPGRTKVYAVEFLYKPLEVGRDVYGTLTPSSIRNENLMGVINYLEENHPTKNMPAPISEVQEEESSDDDPSPSTKRRKLEAAVEDLVDRRIEELGIPVDRAVVKPIFLAEFIVRNKMRPKGVDGNQHELHVESGFVDNVNLTTDDGWFDEFKRLSTNNAHTARGQVEHYGQDLQKRFGRRLKSRIVFFTELSDEMPTFESIVKRYTNSAWGYGLDEVVLVHMSEVDVDKHDARLEVLARRQL